MLHRAISAANNMSGPGLVLKLPAFGGPQLAFEALKYAGWVYTAVVIGAVAWLARRPVAPRYEPLAWLAVLGLTALRADRDRDPRRPRRCRSYPRRCVIAIRRAGSPCVISDR